MKYFICLFIGHKYVKLVIPANPDWGDNRFEGLICRRCESIKNLVENANA